MLLSLTVSEAKQGSNQRIRLEEECRMNDDMINCGRRYHRRG